MWQKNYFLFVDYVCKLLDHVWDCSESVHTLLAAAEHGRCSEDAPEEQVNLPTSCFIPSSLSAQLCQERGNILTTISLLLHCFLEPKCSEGFSPLCNWKKLRFWCSVKSQHFSQGLFPSLMSVLGSCFIFWSIYQMFPLLHSEPSDYELLPLTLQASNELI